MTIIDSSSVQKPQSQRFPCGAALPLQKLCRFPMGPACGTPIQSGKANAVDNPETAAGHCLSYVHRGAARELPSCLAALPLLV